MTVEGRGAVSVGLIRESEQEEALWVIGRGMRDNPLHVAAFGDDPDRRVQCQVELMRIAFDLIGIGRHTLVARTPGGDIAGVCGMISPDDPMPGLIGQLRMLRVVLSLGPRTAWRMTRWLGVWVKHDPQERHWHLGPVAVDAHLQGMGVGTALMDAFCRKMDEAGEMAYLETDKPINVTFYQRFGFQVVAEEDVLGVPNWFMTRNPQPAD